jgi:broad specificity phosphatase PhoE
MFCDPNVHGRDVPIPVNAKYLYLVRHGEGHHNEAARECGFEAYKDSKHFDSALNTLGQQQADEVGAWASAHIDPQIVLVSPLTRALETADRGMAAFRSSVPYANCFLRFSTPAQFDPPPLLNCVCMF